MVMCLQQGADLHISQLMPLLHTISCFGKIQIGILPFWYRLTWVVRRRDVKRVCVCVASVTCLFCVWFCSLHHVSKMMPPYYFLNNSVKSELIWIIIGAHNPEGVRSKQFCFCPPCVQNVTTVPWKVKKSLFQQLVVLSILSCISTSSSSEKLDSSFWVLKIFAMALLWIHRMICCVCQSQ